MKRITSALLANFGALLAMNPVNAVPTSREFLFDPFVGPFRSTVDHHRGKAKRYTVRSKYTPHQGEQEKARRRRQMATRMG